MTTLTSAQTTALITSGVHVHEAAAYFEGRAAPSVVNRVEAALMSAETAAARKAEREAIASKSVVAQARETLAAAQREVNYALRYAGATELEPWVSIRNNAERTLHALVRLYGNV